MKAINIVLVLEFAIALSCQTHADTVISVNGGIGSWGAQGVGPIVEDFEYLCSYWTFTASFSNLAYSVAPGSFEILKTTTTANFYLMNAVGPSATAANVIWSGSGAFLAGGFADGSTPIFSGLTLGPGTYYFIIDPSQLVAWLPVAPYASDGKVTITSANVTFNGTLSPIYNEANVQFPPASSWGVAGYGTPPGSGDGLEDLGFTLSGSSAIPEPSTAALVWPLAACLLARLWLIKRFRAPQRERTESSGSCHSDY